MAKRLIIVGNRAGARFYEGVGRNPNLTFIKSIDHPEGRLKDMEIVSDKQGVSFQTASPAKHQFSSERSPKETELDAFIAQLSEQIETTVYNSEYDSLVLVAEPKMLGKLKEKLKTNSAKKLSATVSKDLINVTDDQIYTHIEPAL